MPGLDIGHEIRADVWGQSSFTIIIVLVVTKSPVNQQASPVF